MKSGNIKWKQFSDDERNTFEFLRMLSHPIIHRILGQLQAKPSTYLELRHVCFPPNTGSTSLAFHLNRLEKMYCIENKNKKYSLTWRGIKAYEFIKMAIEISNLTISNCDMFDTEWFLDVQRSKTWLEPFLESKIDQILAKKCRQSKSRLAR